MKRWSVVLAAWALSGCTFVGQGEGEVRSDRLVAIDCWDDAYDMRPDFFSAMPFDDTMRVRVQRGNDFENFSDGLAILINGVSAIRPRSCTLNSECASGVCSAEGMCQSPDQRGVPIDVGLPAELAIELAPEQPVDPAAVSMALYLNFSCRNKITTLHAIDGTITFNELFSNDPNESAGEEKLTEATFDVTVGNPLDAPKGTLDIPPELTSNLTGNFTFVFQRGQPGQPFP